MQKTGESAIDKATSGAASKITEAAEDMGDTLTGKGSSGVDIDTDDYKPTDLTEDDYKKAFSMTSTIVNAITIIGIIISLVMVMAIGIKYMVGSVEEKAEYKSTMMPMVIGAILLFTSSTIVSVIYNVVSQIQ